MICRPFFLPGSLALALALAACDGPQQPPVDPIQWLPSDAALAAQYQRSCQQCHARAGMGAPQVGDRAAWANRETSSTAELVARVKEGKGAMPPMGWCPDCSDGDLNRLVDFLRSAGQP